MKILHTSDWHLGKNLYNKKRHDEHQAFLNHLLQLLDEQGVNILLLAGDVFDTFTPNQQSQTLYYQFLAKASQLPQLQHLVIIAGNHDSPLLLEAPKEILRHLQIHIVGHPHSQNPEEEVLKLQDSAGQLQALVCAVPYLRDQDIRNFAQAQSSMDKAQRIRQGISEHFAQVFAHAMTERQVQSHWVPLLAMGHLFVTGAKTQENDGVRDLYVGTLGEVSSDIFPRELDYVALGHIHQPQVLGQRPEVRYCGAPLAMSFAELGHAKEVVILEMTPEGKTITPIALPSFARLNSIKGNYAEILHSLDNLIAENTAIWCEVQYTGDDAPGNIHHLLQQHTQNSAVEILKIQKLQTSQPLAESFNQPPRLDELTPEEVFVRRLAAEHFNEDTQNALTQRFHQAVHGLQNPIEEV